MTVPASEQPRPTLAPGSQPTPLAAPTAPTAPGASPIEVGQPPAEAAYVQAGYGEQVIDQALTRMGLASLADLSVGEQRLITQVLEELTATGRSPTLDNLWQRDYTTPPVSPEEFFLNDYYLGRVGRSIYPVLLEELKYVLDPANHIMEWILTGAIGFGKSTSAVAAQVYKMYTFLCLRDPYEYYQMMPGSYLCDDVFWLDSRARRICRCGLS